MTKDRWTLRRRRAGTVHIVRWWEVCCDGEVVDTFDFENLDIAQALIDYRNDRERVGAPIWTPGKPFPRASHG